MLKNLLVNYQQVNDGVVLMGIGIRGFQPRCAGSSPATITNLWGVKHRGNLRAGRGSGNCPLPIKEIRIRTYVNMKVPGTGKQENSG